MSETQHANKHTHTLGWQHEHSATAVSEGLSLSLVDWSKHFSVSQSVNSNQIKATWEVFIPLLQ